MKEFRDKVAVITGAGSGIGRQLAILLAGEGMRLAMADRDLEGLKETETLLIPGSVASLHEVDVADEGQMVRFGQEVTGRHAAVDLLINNAGITLTPTPFGEIPPESFKRVVDVNMWGVYYGIRVFLAALQERPGSVIVNISSLAGLVGLYGYSPYVMSKFAVRGLTETLQSEFSRSNIHLLIVHSGGVKTALIQHAPDLENEVDRRTAHGIFNQTALLEADQLAARILRAVRRRQRYLIVGMDARIVLAIRWLFPRHFPTILGPIFRQVDFKSKPRWVR